jgi:hypothetical protein
MPARWWFVVWVESAALLLLTGWALWRLAEKAEALTGFGL